jgi:hypothetical protein
MTSIGAHVENLSNTIIQTMTSLGAPCGKSFKPTGIFFQLILNVYFLLFVLTPKRKKNGFIKLDKYAWSN